MRGPLAPTRTASEVKRFLFFVLAVGLVSCGPGGGPPTNLTIRVANARAQTSHVMWQSGGLFGTTILASTGDDQVAGCSVYTRTFDSLQTKITISVADQSLDVDLGTNTGNGAERDFLIGFHEISEVDPVTLPISPCN